MKSALIEWRLSGVRIKLREKETDKEPKDEDRQTLTSFPLFQSFNKERKNERGDNLSVYYSRNRNWKKSQTTDSTLVGAASVTHRDV